ncbi:MAG: transaldolase family protein [Terriglobia bacterium]
MAAIEEAAAEGVNINTTVCFTLPQCVALAEAMEAGLRRREKACKPISDMGPVCTIMVGRLDDWLKVVMEKRNITTDPGYLEWGGVAVFKKTYRLFQERGYRVRLLAAAYRNHMHWSELGRSASLFRRARIFARRVGILCSRIPTIRFSGVMATKVLAPGEAGNTPLTMTSAPSADTPPSPRQPVF